VIKTKMAARRQVMKQSGRAKGSELAVALLVERIKSTETYAQMGARVGITEDRARELVARGVRKVAYGNAECSLSMDDLKTARLRNRLPPWDIGLLERKLFGSAETRWQIDEA
jgi:hypothetical protein